MPLPTAAVSWIQTGSYHCIFMVQLLSLIYTLVDVSPFVSRVVLTLFTNTSVTGGKSVDELLPSLPTPALKKSSAVSIITTLTQILTTPLEPFEDLSTSNGNYNNVKNNDNITAKMPTATTAFLPTPGTACTTALTPTYYRNDPQRS